MSGSVRVERSRSLIRNVLGSDGRPRRRPAITLHGSASRCGSDLHCKHRVRDFFFFFFFFCIYLVQFVLLRRINRLFKEVSVALVLAKRRSQLFVLNAQQLQEKASVILAFSVRRKKSNLHMFSVAI